MLKTAVVVGNGTSRSVVDIKKLTETATVYGCNALYRDATPDHLIAVDTKMIREITATGYHLTHSVWSNPNSYTRAIEKLNLFDPCLGWSSGPSALHLATQHGFEQIYILGFDYTGLGKKQEHVNNIYADTVNYKKSNERATYYGNWARQTASILRSNPSVKYIRAVVDVNSFVPDVLRGHANLIHITVEDFIKKFMFS
jgi:hypothetical protein